MTPHDRYQRRIDLAGEIKQADELVNECRNDVEAKRKALELAEQALSKQIGLRADKHDEARRLAKEAHDDFMSLVPEANGAGDDGNLVFAIVDVGQQSDGSTVFQNAFESPLYTNGEVRLNAVFDEATHP